MNIVPGFFVDRTASDLPPNPAHTQDLNSRQGSGGAHPHGPEHNASEVDQRIWSRHRIYLIHIYAAATNEVKRKLLAAFYSRVWLEDDGITTLPMLEEWEVMAYIRDPARQAVGGAEATKKVPGRVPAPLARRPSGKSRRSFVRTSRTW